MTICYYIIVYLFIGFIWATITVYRDWAYPDLYTDFWFAFLLWWMDILRKGFCWIIDWGRYYERRLHEIRNDKLNHHN